MNGDLLASKRNKYLIGLSLDAGQSGAAFRKTTPHPTYGRRGGEIVADGISGYVVPKGDGNALIAVSERLEASDELHEQMGWAVR